MKNKEFKTIKEVSDEKNIPISTVYHFIETKAIETVKFGTVTLVPIKAYDKIVAR